MKVSASDWGALLALPLFLYFICLAACSPRPIVPTPTPFPYNPSIDSARRDGRTLQAIYLVEAAAAENGWTPELTRMAGDLWQQVGDLPRALEFWEITAAVEPDDATLRVLADVNIQLGRWTEAKDTLERLAADPPNDPWVDLQLGLIEAPFDPRSAEAHLRAAMRQPAYVDTATRLQDVLITDPADPLISMRVGFAMLELELWPNAELAFDHAANLAAPYPLALAYVGYVRDRQGKDGGAWIDDALALEPDNADIQFLYGLHLRAAGQNAASIEAFTQAVTLDPNNPGFQAELGTAYRLVGDLESAEFWLLTAVESSNNDARFTELLALFYSDEVSNLTGGGLTALASVANSLPDDADVQAGYGWALYLAGDTEGGRARINTALSLTPDNPRALYYKARILLDDGDTDMARTLLQALANGDSDFADDAQVTLDTEF
jgi:tetratricopeptide (TPR) repeat protein